MHYREKFKKKIKVSGTELTGVGAKIIIAALCRSHNSILYEYFIHSIDILE
jgi:hypothetical protein